MLFVRMEGKRAQQANVRADYSLYWDDNGAHKIASRSFEV